MIHLTDLAVESKKIILKDADYSEVLQSRFSVKDDALNATSNGTQTYTSGGKPCDSDSD